MHRTVPPTRRVSALALAGLVYALAGSQPTLAAPPAESDFRVLYYITDEDGNRGRQMSQQDMELFVNKARCECNQKIITRITFQGSGVDAEQILAMVGQRCDTAQQSPGLGNYKLCAQLTAGLPQVFQTSPEFAFSPLWLSVGVQGSNQSIATATPAGSCDDGLEGSGGLWMCSGVTNCQMGSFFMSGTWNANIPDGQSASGILFDYLPPVSPPTDFTASPGDSSVQISWKNLAPGDIAGYRVLCADENDNPVDNGISFTPPSPTAIVNGTIYYTASNLCPDGAFGGDAPGDGDGDAETGDGDGDGETGDGDGDLTGDGDGDLTGDGDGDAECPQGSEGCPCYDDRTCDGTMDCDLDDVCVQISCTPGEFGCTCLEGGVCDEPYECSSNNFCGTPTTGIHSLDWAYVCSDHLGFNTTSTRISGLENGKTYTFLVVAYDRAGNPIFGESIEARPVPTNGLWEQCESQGGVCGEGWTCSVVDEPRDLGWLFGGLGLAGLGGAVVWRRRRRRA
ncbi:MAG: fibronectin type III domain-containing protein [Enhygromyxa sp.]